MFDKAWKVVVLILVVGALGSSIAYWAVQEPKREMTPLMYQLADKVTQDFARELPRREEINSLLVLVKGRGGRDEENQFKGLLAERVERAGKYQLWTWSRVEKVLEENQTIFTKVLQELNLVPGVEPTTIKQAAKAIDWLEKANYEPIDGVMLVEVTSFTEGPGEDGLGSQVGVQAEIFSTKQKKTVASVGPLSEAIESAWDLRYLSYTIGRQSLLWRFPLWLLVACGLPWALIAVVRQVLKRRSNGANIGLLIGFTVVSVGLGWVLLTAFGTGGGTVVSLVVMAGLMGYYNYDALDYIERRLL